MADTAQPNRHVRIDNRIITEHVARVGPSAFTVYAILVKFADNTTRRCYPSITTIARLAGCSRTTVIRAIRTLEAAGMLTVERVQSKAGDWGNNVYTLTSPDRIGAQRTPGTADSPHTGSNGSEQGS